MTLPIIDMSDLWSDDTASKKRIGNEIREACLDKGFFYLRGHGISADMREESLGVIREFFALPLEEKLKVDKAQSNCNRGYEKLRGQTLEPGAPADIKEGYYIGRDLSEDDPRVVSGKFNHGPNIWPKNLPQFRDKLENYYEQMLGVARTLMRGLALSLRLDEIHFDEFSRDELATLRLLHYPEQPPNPKPGEKGAGAHTDFGTLTLLLQDDSGGLQVRDEAAGWIDAPPIKDTYVVNLGDMIARWTNDTYRSTLHRVINHSGHDRYSIPFFYMGNPD
ncbi:MAG: isopenicillin N synthase family dioxygenase, partial [Methyloligellaceae bacterium]